LIHEMELFKEEAQTEQIEKLKKEYQETKVQMAEAFRSNSQKAEILISKEKKNSGINKNIEREKS
jgi:hypothetical protein